MKKETTSSVAQDFSSASLGVPPCFSPMAGLPFGNIFQQASDYWLDTMQRSVLFLDVLRQRGNAHFEHMDQTAPNVLHFDHEMIIDGRDLLQPVNYMLLRIIPPEGVVLDPTKRPFMVFDPRAGHGPGIGGMKKDSEIGMALQSGHPCYFVGFLPKPVKGQTIEDVCRAEAIFVSKVIEMHPLADRPTLVGNCQAGWQISLMSAMEPELPGVLILAGTPMSYWSGVRGNAPMRYAGGMTGGTWVTSLWSDLGNGLFDGAWLVHNFENMNPSNTHWKKNYNLYSKVDTEAERFLDFERWWGSPILLGSEEIQFIVDELFIGNRLSTARLRLSGGVPVDLRSIKSPIVVFCSRGDDITPPPQALGWILDLYTCDDEIIAYGQTIVYAMHDNIGHLGIFVSNSVARKEHEKFIHNIDLIETLPPGLYEAIIVDKTVDTINADLASGQFIMRFEKRGLDDIRALGCNDQHDEMRFAAVSRISENLQGLYNTFLAPTIRASMTDDAAELIRSLHPARVRFQFFSDKNPWLYGLDALAANVRQNRKPVSQDNIFLNIQERISNQIVSALDQYRDYHNNATESFFMAFYGSPLIQAMVGLRTVRPYVRQTAGRDLQREKDITRRLQELQDQFAVGGLNEALVRALIYINRGSKGLDEREFGMLRRLRQESKTLPALTQMEYKNLVRQQYMMLLLDESRALQAIPLLLDRANGGEIQALELIRSVTGADGTVTDEEQKRLKRIESLFVPANANFRRRMGDPPHLRSI